MICITCFDWTSVRTAGRMNAYYGDSLFVYLQPTGLLNRIGCSAEQAKENEYSKALNCFI